MASLSYDDKILIRSLRLEKGWSATRLCKCELKERRGTRTSVKRPKTRKHFSESLMVSVAVSKLGKTSMVFVQPGAKINSVY